MMAESRREQESGDAKTLIAGFIDAQVVRRGLDWRTGEAYRIDLEHFYKWLEDTDRKAGQDGHGWQEKMEAYLEYLTLVKKLRPSTVARKYRVFNYYLAYLARQGLLLDCGPLKPRLAAGRLRRRSWAEDDLADVDDLGNVGGWGTTGHTHIRDDGDRMSKTDVDAFFLALEREYDGLESDFRKRVCLRDLVMMELLFYHGIEVSELLRLEVSDYDRKTGILQILKKRGKVSRSYLYSRALRERMERWLSEHGYFEREARYRERMFLSKLGRPLSMKMVINIFGKYRVLAGIQKEVTPKDLKRCMGGYARELMKEYCDQR